MKIVGKSVLTAAQLDAYAKKYNPDYNLALGAVFIEAGDIEGVRGDLHFFQCCIETGYFKFDNGTAVTVDQNNYCGMGVTQKGMKGNSFDTPLEGAIAGCQHLKAYGSTEDICYHKLLDPRWSKVTRGCAPEFEDLGGRWAVPGYDTKKYSSIEEAKKAGDSYGHKIVKKYEECLALFGDLKEDTKEEVKEPEVVKPYKVMIDPGHKRGYNKSPVNPAYNEGDTVWKLSNYLKEEIEALGGIAKLTRTSTDHNPSLNARGIASDGYDLFISEHTDACATPSVNRVTVFCLVNDKDRIIDDISKEIGTKLGQATATTMGVSLRVTQRVSANDRNKDGQLGNDEYYGVLNGAQSVDTPGVLIENSFHTNLAVTNWLLIDANLRKLAKAQAQAIHECLSKVERVEKVEDTKVDEDFETYLIKVSKTNVPIQKGPTVNSKLLGYCPVGIYTVVGEAEGPGATKWYLLKSGKANRDKWVSADMVTKVGETEEEKFQPYLVRVKIPDLNIRKAPTTDAAKESNYCPVGIYTIVEEANGKGASKWLLIKSGMKNRDRWISADYVEKV